MFTATTSGGKPIIGVANSLKYRDFPHKTEFPWLLEFVIEFGASDERGLPTPSELGVVESFQAEVLAALTDITTVHKIGHVTGNDAREFFCYVREPNSVNAMLTLLTDKPSKRPFQFRITQDPNWDFAKELGI